MISLNLTASDEQEEIIKNYLEENVSEVLAEKLFQDYGLLPRQKRFVYYGLLRCIRKVMAVFVGTYSERL